MREQIVEMSGFVVWLRRMTDNKPLFYLFMTLFLMGLPLVLLGYFTRSAYDMLAASRQTPWGIVTSLVVHEDLIHFGGNMAMLFAFLLLLVAIHDPLPREVLTRRSSIVSVSVLVSAVVANVVFMVFSPARASGASGVVYALEGMVLGFSLTNFLPSSLKADEVRRHFTSRENRRLIRLNGVVLAYYLLFVVLAPTLFLAAAPGVNSFVHGVAFLLALGGAVTYSAFKERNLQ